MIIFRSRSPIFVLAACVLSLVSGMSALALTEDERTRASSLFKAYREAMSANNHDSAADVIATLIADLPGEAAAVAHRQILDESESMARAFVRDVEALTARDDARAAQRDPQVLQDRALLAEIMATSGDAAQKVRLAEEGWPALERLRAKLLPDPGARIVSNTGLRHRRDAILFRLDLCDDLAAHAKLPRNARIREQLEFSATGGAGLMAIATARDRRVLENNRKIAESGEVPELDVLGIEDANRLRMLAGLPALLIDPALCKAALIHSTDMFERKFFAHESPVQGRRSYTDRAREAGTTASAENIGKGQRDAAAANRGWFHSPGHFRNFFGNHNRIGLGSHERHYTQLFGN